LSDDYWQETEILFKIILISFHLCKNKKKKAIYFTKE